MKNKLEILIDKKLANIDLTQALNKAAIAVENKAKELVPVDTGELRRSITHRVEGNEAYVYSTLRDVPYSIYIEFGTGLFAENGDGRQDVPWRYQTEDGQWHSTLGQKPQPFLRPALQQSEKEILEIIKEEVAKCLTQN